MPLIQVGHYDELLEKGQAFAEFLRTYSQLEGEEEEIDDRATSGMNPSFYLFHRNSLF